MKKKTQPKNSHQQSIGDWIKGVGLTLLVASAVACILDVFVVSSGVLSVPFWGYLILILSGVALQFVGSGFPQMKFQSRFNKPKRKELHRIDH